ncbi:geranylgeranylglycerol-phosphate geranylgeranyltransferase [Rurimicrobium arvi]|uniref:Geranylgeranylglycerol-phosphate geranylgeranyltransferase n=1 Tax=Rurimicrobium arvi TaxID=2049916 RepID=A0ABP8N166_9BACT
MAWLRLVRWNNLFIVMLTQLLVWCCVLLPLHAWTDTPFLLGPLHFALVCTSTILIAAAGYIINDYFDIKIDAINRPQKAILDRVIDRRQAIIAHSVLNVLALVLAGAVALSAGKWYWLFVQLFSTVLLFFYSSHFKRLYVIGNVVVALLTALTIFTLFIYEPGLWYFVKQPPMLRKGDAELANPIWVLGIYTGFAFVLTWMREIVKDMEDHIGDAAEGCVTMPIKLGLKRTARFIQLISLGAIIPLVIASVKVQGLLGIYTFFVLTLPLTAWVLLLNRRASTQHYHRMSRYLKVIMVSGIGSLIVYYFQANA